MEIALFVSLAAAFAPPGSGPIPLRWRMGTSVFLQATADVVVTAPALTAEQLLVQQPRSGMLLSEVIDTMMAALHRTNSDSPDRPYLGCEVALRFLSTTHQAAQLCNSGGPPAFARYMRQPHKQPLATWSEYRYLGSPTVMTDMTTASSGESEARQEAYQQVEVRQNSEVEWSKVRWLLVMEDGAWRVDGVFSEEPDEPDDGQLYRDLEAVAKAAPLDLETQRRLFAEFDADSSGALDEQEIALIVSRLGIRISGEEMHKLYREVSCLQSPASRLLGIMHPIRLRGTYSLAGRHRRLRRD
jgi:hypothetical protein